jgi:hypothetical protein
MCSVRFSEQTAIASLHNIHGAVRNVFQDIIANFRIHQVKKNLTPWPQYLPSNFNLTEIQIRPQHVLRWLGIHRHNLVSRTSRKPQALHT